MSPARRGPAGAGGIDGWELRGGQFLVPTGTPEVAAHPDESRETFYNRIVIPVLKAVLRAQGLRVHVVGSEHVPATGGGLIASNHTNYYDFALGQVPAHLRGRRLTRFMAKKEIFDVPVVGRLMAAMKHISVDRSAGASSVTAAVERLRSGQLVGIFPEATISRSFEIKELKTGAVRIAAAAGVPLVPMVTWGGQRIWTKGLDKNLGRSHVPVLIRVGEPVDTAGDPEAATARLREALRALLDAARADYERLFGPAPAGAPWQPAARGGGAPTLEQAAEIDARERAARRAAKEAKAARKAGATEAARSESGGKAGAASAILRRARRAVRRLVRGS